MPFDINAILEQATADINTAETSVVADAVADRLAKLKAALAERESEFTKYTKKLADFTAEIAQATTASDAMKIVNKKAFTVKFLHLND